MTLEHPGRPARGLATAGFDWVTTHTFRKTVATLMDHAGLSARAAADQLGHANTSMTTDVYSGRKVAITGRRQDAPPARDPKHYVHGLDGAGVVLVPARVAAWLHAQLPIHELRKSVRGMDAEVDHVLIGLSVASLNWRSSVYGTRPRNVPEPAPKSAWLTTTQVADLLNQTDRAIRSACKSGRLPADRIGDRWRISREDFEHYRTARAS